LVWSKHACAKGREGLAALGAAVGCGADGGGWEDARRRHAAGDALGQVAAPTNPRRNTSAFRAATATTGGTGWTGGVAIVAKVVGVWGIGEGFAETKLREMEELKKVDLTPLPLDPHVVAPSSSRA
jgi:hypothetical protein